MKNNNSFVCAYNTTSDAGMDTSSFSVFTNGCNLCCPYCMNNKLLSKEYDIKPDTFKNLSKDVKLYKPEMIFISGGEPTEKVNELLKIIKTFKTWGCKVGMSTNGTNPDTLNKCLSKLDYVAMDLKGDQNVYSLIGDPDNYINVLSSWTMLRKEKGKRNSFGYEIRTTLYPAFISIGMLDGMANFFNSDEKWIWQQFRPVDCMPHKSAKSVLPFKESEIKEMIEFIEKRNENIKDITMRYI